MTARPLVLGLGGNALVGPDGAADVAHQRRRLARAAPALARAISGRACVVTHGNGPQVGHLARMAAAVGDLDPLDVLDALTQGLLGYLIEDELSRHLPERSLVAVLTRVEVDPDDPGLTHATKPVGPRRSDGTRRLVPSPEPRRVLELDAVRDLLDRGHLVIAGGGGGVPVVLGPDGLHRGVEAVVDKDLLSSLLAVHLDAESLVLLTDVDGVARDWGTDRATTLGEVPASRLEPAAFQAGSMRPKVEAARRFVLATGRRAAIGALSRADAVVDGSEGTQVLPG